MGNFYSTLWPSKENVPKVYIKPSAKKGTVLTAVEDIQKLTPEQLEESFENLCNASHKVLRSLTHNPCGQLSLRIKQCLDENVQQMSKCFRVMDDYRACVNNMMSEKLNDMVTDFEKPGERARAGDHYDMTKEDDMAEELEERLKRHVEELKPKQSEKKEKESEGQTQEQFKKKACKED